MDSTQRIGCILSDDEQENDEQILNDPNQSQSRAVTITKY